MPRGLRPAGPGNHHGTRADQAAACIAFRFAFDHDHGRASALREQIETGERPGLRQAAPFPDEARAIGAEHQRQDLLAALGRLVAVDHAEQATLRVAVFGDVHRLAQARVHDRRRRRALRDRDDRRRLVTGRMLAVSLPRRRRIEETELVSERASCRELRRAVEPSAKRDEIAAGLAGHEFRPRAGANVDLERPWLVVDPPRVADDIFVALAPSARKPAHDQRVGMGKRGARQATLGHSWPIRCRNYARIDGVRPGARLRAASIASRTDHERMTSTCILTRDGNRSADRAGTPALARFRL
jgi:hypothetical protein